MVAICCFSCSRYAQLNNTESAKLVPKAIQTFTGTSYAGDDPAQYDEMFNEHDQFAVRVSDPYWLIPSGFLDPNIQVNTSNNNVNICRFADKVYLAFRTSSSHFASDKSKMQIISTSDGIRWIKDYEIETGSDVREPHFLTTGDTLRFYYFIAGTKISEFKPESIQMIWKTTNGPWSDAVQIMEKQEVHWSIKNRNGKYYATTYTGSHYDVFGKSKVKLRFKESTDGQHWYNVMDSNAVYVGGVSEVDFEFTSSGHLWAVGRLEDGDKTGFGSQIFFAVKDSLHYWQYLERAQREALMSPKVFRHGDDIYLISRRQLGKRPFGYAPKFIGMPLRRVVNWVTYSLSPKTTALFRLDQKEKKLVHIKDLPGAGDTAFPSVLRLDKDKILLANYTSHPRHKNRSWLKGQFNPTYIYLALIEFEKK